VCLPWNRDAFHCPPRLDDCQDSISEKKVSTAVVVPLLWMSLYFSPFRSTHLARRGGHLIPVGHDHAKLSSVEQAERLVRYK
jgi:hypothetical protein